MDESQSYKSNVVKLINSRTIRQDGVEGIGPLTTQGQLGAQGFSIDFDSSRTLVSDSGVLGWAVTVKANHNLLLESIRTVEEGITVGSCQSIINKAGEKYVDPARMVAPPPTLGDIAMALGGNGTTAADTEDRSMVVELSPNLIYTFKCGITTHENMVLDINTTV